MTYQVPILFNDILSQAHTLIAGQTGSGKSVMLNGILTTANIKGGNALILVDPKRVELRDYKEQPNVVAYANTSSETVQALDTAIRTMEDRYKQMEKERLKDYDGADLYVVIDELADLLISKDGKRIKAQLQTLTALGRASRVHCICATQQPSRKMLPAELTLNFTGRVALHCQTAIESRQVINVGGAEDLPMYGRCLYLRPRHNLEGWEVPMTTEAQKQLGIELVKRDYERLEKPTSIVKKILAIA